MDPAPRAARRTVARVEDKIHLGGDAQVDDRNVVIMPVSPATTDPFLLLSEDWFSTTGFDWHPHRGLETVTLVLDGVLEHGDNLGHDGALAAGDVQWMTAGRGIIHREMAWRDERAHVLQMWVNLPAELKMVETGYQDLPQGTRPVVDHGGVRIEVLAGEFDGVVGPARPPRPVHGALVTLDPGQTYELGLPADHRAFVYGLSGQVAVAGRPVNAGQVAWSDPVAGARSSSLSLATGPADRPSTVVVWSGRPIGQPVVMGGPFVMTSEAEIAEAFADFRHGRFGPVPRRARLA
jgi:redox-sensitive bicupin YhaK (pirin superfamily)